MNIIMKSEPFRVTKTRRTKAKFWEDVEVGDVLLFKQAVGPQGMGRGLYAVDLVIVNTTQGVSFTNTMNQATSNMQGFEMEVNV